MCRYWVEGTSRLITLDRYTVVLLVQNTTVPPTVTVPIKKKKKGTSNGRRSVVGIG